MREDWIGDAIAAARAGPDGTMEFSATDDESPASDVATKEESMTRRDRSTRRMIGSKGRESEEEGAAGVWKFGRVRWRGVEGKGGGNESRADGPMKARDEREACARSENDGPDAILGTG